MAKRGYTASAAPSGLPASLPSYVQREFSKIAQAISGIAEATPDEVSASGSTIYLTIDGTKYAISATKV